MTKHINGHFCKCASISQRLVTFIQTTGKRQSVRVWPYSGPGTWPVHCLPSYITQVTSARFEKHTKKRYMRLWLWENSDFLGLETPDKFKMLQVFQNKRANIQVKKEKKNKTVLASRPGAISTCFPLVALASSNIRKERLVIHSEPSAWFGLLIRQKWREDGAREKQ